MVKPERLPVFEYPAITNKDAVRDFVEVHTKTMMWARTRPTKRELNTDMEAIRKAARRLRDLLSSNFHELHIPCPNDQEMLCTWKEKRDMITTIKNVEEVRLHPVGRRGRPELRRMFFKGLLAVWDDKRAGPGDRINFLYDCCCAAGDDIDLSYVEDLLKNT